MNDPRDPLGLRRHAALFDAWLTFDDRVRRPFTLPGHKQRTDLLGDLVAGDIPLYAGLDTMKLAHGRLAAAERAAASWWGADVARFSTGGSTHGNQALLLAVGKPGERIVVSRTAHRSVLSGLVLADLVPQWVRPRVDRLTGLPASIGPDEVAAGLSRSPDAVAVLTTDPQYVGTYGDLGAVAEVAHRAGIPLLVDAAWGAHFGAHPQLPPHPLTAGADAMVTSVHKALPGLNQAALIVARTTRIDPDRLEAAVEATATTSPSGAILASIDLARAVVQHRAPELVPPVLAAVARARGRLRGVPALTVVDGPGIDPLKLVLVLDGTGADGVSVEADLIAAGYPVELADRDTLVAMVTLIDRPSEIDDLAERLVTTVERHRAAPRSLTPAAAWSVEPEQVLTPREAFFAGHRRVAAAAAVGRVCAEVIAPYPPGIPVLAPGERVTEAALDALRAARAAGTRIAYAADPTVATIRVVA